MVRWLQGSRSRKHVLVDLELCTCHTALSNTELLAAPQTGHSPSWLCVCTSCTSCLGCLVLVSQSWTNLLMIHLCISLFLVPVDLSREESFQLLLGVVGLVAGVRETQGCCSWVCRLPCHSFNVSNAFTILTRCT